MGVIRFIMIAFFMVCLPLNCISAGPDKIVAVVNDVNLTEAELNQEINVLMPMNQSFHGSLSDEKMVKIRSEALKNLVGSELRAQDALKQGIKVSPAEIDDEQNKILKKFNSKKEFINALNKAGFTGESFAQSLKRRLLSGKVRKLAVEDKILVTQQSVKAYYDKNASKYLKPEEYRASIILLKVDPASTKEARSLVLAKANKLHKKISEGSKFEDVAAEESDDPSRIKGGDLGYFHIGQLISEFEGAVSKLKVGEVGAIVETLQGYIIVKLTDKRPPRQITYDEIQDKISKDLVDSEKNRLIADWMANLYNKSVVTYPEKNSR